MYTIKEVSQKTNLTYHTIRYYTDQELIPEVIRDENNNRLFSERSINIFLCLKHLKNSGLTIKELKEFVDLGELGDVSIAQRRKIMTKAKEKMKQKMMELENSMNYLDYKESFYDQILNNEIADRGVFNKKD